MSVKPFLLGGVAILVAATAGGVFLEPGPRRTVYLLLLSGTLGLGAFRFALKQRSEADEIALLAALASGAHFLAHAAGGLLANGESLYLVLAGLAAVTFSTLPILVLLGVLIGLEGAAVGLREAGSVPELLRLTGLLAAVASSFAFLQRSERRRAERAEQELRRLNLGLHTLSEEEEEGESPFTEEGKRIGKIEYVRELDERLLSLLELTCRSTGSRGAFLFQVDHGGRDLLLRLTTVPEIARERLASVATSLISRVLEEGKTLVIRERDRPLPVLPWYRKQPAIRSLAAIPIRAGEKTDWILVLDHDQPDHFEGAAREIAERFAAEISRWQENLRQLAELDLLSEELRRLHHASATLSQALRVEEILQQVASFSTHIARFDSLAICLVEEGEEHFTVALARGYPGKVQGARFPLESPTWAGWLLRTGDQPLTVRFQRRTGMPVLYAGEPAASGTSFLGIPLLAKNRVSGALFMTRRGKPFGANDVHVLRIFCNQAAVAIENARVYERLERMAATDALTGLFNRRYFQQALEMEISRAERAGGSLALLLLDIDHFKELNDTYGHAMGDLVLKNLAGVVQGALRKGDVLARYGGEEFVILLPGVAQRSAQSFAERVRKAVASTPMHPGGARKEVTVSIGWALFPEDASEPERLVEMADRALYFAKDAGRNRVAGYHLLRAEVEL